MKDRSKESNSWPVIIVCVIVGFIFFGNYIFDYFGIKLGNEEIVEKVANQPPSVTSNIVEKSLNKNVDKIVDLADDKSQNESSDKLDETKTDTNGDTVTDVEKINMPSPKIGFIRVEKDGSGIISGTGKAGSSVSVLLNDKPVADGIIGGDGQFALFFDLPELDQPYRLTLKQTQSNGDSTESLESALISPSVKKDPFISSSEGAVASAGDDTVASAGDDTVASAGDDTVASAGDDTVASASDDTVASASDDKESVVSSEKKIPTIVIVDDKNNTDVIQTPSKTLDQGKEDNRLGIEVITYDDEGEVTISGKGIAGDFVRIYIDDQAVKLTTVGKDGLWNTPLTGIKQGLYTLRADEVASDGSVVGRVETPFKRESISLAIKGSSNITVQPGYTLWAIARERYGSGFQYVRVYQANLDLIKDPDLIYPGQVFNLPGE